ncbi:MAG: AMP-binding protein [Pirellulaceae bacterium]
MSILNLFEQQVRETPQAVAIVFEDQQLTFEQLDELAAQFANALLNEGVELGQSIGLCIDRCPQAIAAMLGAFKIGAVFVPLDPDYPLDRLAYMIEDAQIRVIITHHRQNNPLARSLQDVTLRDAPVAWIDSYDHNFSRQSTTLPTHYGKPDADDLAYIMYTSGSTGKPKGVQIEHQALTTYCLADIEVYRLTAADRTLQFSTLNFDIAIEEIFPPLLIGGSVVIRPSQRGASSNELSEIIENYGVTAIHLATAYWHEWVDLMAACQARVPSTLRLTIATGEKVSVEHYRRWLRLCDHPVLWCNAYGPTETTVTCTVYIPPDDFAEDNMPIGQARRATRTCPERFASGCSNG